MAKNEEPWGSLVIKEAGRTIRYTLDRWRRTAALLTVLITLVALARILGISI